MNFILRDEDWPLINAAIKLGRWIYKQDITNDKKEIVNKLIEALSILPVPTIGLNAEYGFHVLEKTNDGIDIDRSWTVTMYPAQWAECVLEIISTYCTNPRSEDICDELDNELGFILKNDGKSFNHDFNFERWIREVDDPDVYKAISIEFEIDIY